MGAVVTAIRTGLFITNQLLAKFDSCIGQGLPVTRFPFSNGGAGINAVNEANMSMTFLEQGIGCIQACFKIVGHNSEKDAVFIITIEQDCNCFP